MAQKSLLSSPIAYPTGNFLKQNEDPDQNYDPSTRYTTGGVRDWVDFDADGTIILQTIRNTMSVTHDGDGTYTVTCSNSRPFSPQATPLSTEEADPEVNPINRQWLTTQDVENDETHVLYDPVKDVVWVTDIDHEASLVSGIPDRIAIGNMNAESPETYLYLPAEFPVLFPQDGDTLMLDLTNRMAFVQASSTGGTRTTLIYDMDSYELLQSSNSQTAGTQRVIIGHTPTQFLVRGDGDLRVFNRSSGLVGTLGTTASDIAIGFKWGIKTNSGKLWYRDSTSPADWREIDVSGGGFTSNTRDAGTNGISDRIYDYNPNDNCIYYLNNNSADLRIAKILCESPFTVTNINSTAYPNGGSEDLTILGITTIRFTPDYSKLIAIRGNAGGTPYFYILDPSDGSIDAALQLPDELSSEYASETIVSLAGIVVSVGSFNIQVIGYSVGTGGSSLSDELVVVKTRALSETQALIECYKSWDPNKVKVDHGVHVEFVGD